MTWYDSRDSILFPTQVKLYGAVSDDGGRTWSKNMAICAGLSNADAAYANQFGTATGGTDTTLVDTTQKGVWTNGQWKGAVITLFDAKGDVIAEAIIDTNKGDTIEIQGKWVFRGDPQPIKGLTYQINGVFDFGDYTGLAFYNNAFYPVWADNSNSTRNNPSVGGVKPLDIYTARVTVAVVNGALNVQPDTITASEGQGNGPITVATFTDTTPNAQSTDYTATIIWGDGNTSSGNIIALDNGTFEVQAPHTYEEAGSYTDSITVERTSDSTAVEGTSTATVDDVPLFGSPVGLGTATRGQLLNGPVAAFTDANPSALLSDFTATIDWGDGTTSNGTVILDPSSGFDILGSHTYTAIGKFVLTINILDVGGSTAQVTNTVTVGNVTLNAINVFSTGIVSYDDGLVIVAASTPI